MRLLHSRKLELEEFHGSNIPPYAILSHTWGEGEVTFQDMQGGVAEKMAGYEKVKKTCTLAASCGYAYIWIDTCCIDKTSSAELSEAINSMFRWYEAAGVCFAYLVDVHCIEASEDERFGTVGFASTRWFTRGWTLQELIAPGIVIFLGNTWESIGTKTSLQAVISRITGIPIDILLGGGLGNASVAQRMSWASTRETTRVEDLAYSLLGIFGIHMPLLYGEGDRSFIRLQEEIMKVSDDYSLFAWRYSDNHNGLLSSSVAAFKDCGNVVQLKPFNRFRNLNGPLTTSNKGIHLSVPFKDLGDQKGLIVLNCTKKGNDEDNTCYAIRVRDVSLTKEYFERDQCETLELLDMRYLECPLRNICVKRAQPTRKRELELEEDKTKTENVIMDAMKRNAARWTRAHSSDDESEKAESSNELLNTSNVALDFEETREATLLKVHAKLYEKGFNAAVWKERGFGTLKINVSESCIELDEDGKPVPSSFKLDRFDFERLAAGFRRHPRIIMHEKDTHRTLLNVFIIHAMEFQTQRTISSTRDSPLLFTIIEDETPISMLLMMSGPDAALFKREIDFVQSGL